MTFEAHENSKQGATPVELYEIEYGPMIFRLVNSDTPYVYLSKDYTAVQIKRTAVEETSELGKNDLTVTVPRDNPVAELFRIYPPSQEVSITVYRVHRTDTDQERKTVWVGRILTCKWRGAWADLHCENLFTSFRRKGLRRRFQRACPHVLYGPECRAPKASFLTVATITVVDGPVLNSAEFDALPAGWLPGGILEWERSADLWELRTIKDHLDDEITLNQSIVGLVAGATVNVYPGCAHDKADCVGKFNNILNYGGFTDIPRKNPFGAGGAF